MVAGGQVHVWPRAYRVEASQCTSNEVQGLQFGRKSRGGREPLDGLGGSWVFGVGRPFTLASQARSGRSAAARNLVVAENLKEFLAATCAAGTHAELEDATDLLAKAIEALEVPEFLTLLRRHEAPPKVEEAKVEETQPKRKPRRVKKTWVELKVVWECTGEPVPGVRLVFTAPNGDQEYQTTNFSGLIRVDNIDPGECDVACKLDSPLWTNTLAFSGLGEPSTKDTEQTASDARPVSPKRSGVQHIAHIETHKVKTGENLEKLAEGADLSWQELAKFNWGTDKPKDINEHLRDEVGCTHKTEESKN